MNVTGKTFWVPGVLIALLVVMGGCSTKSVQGSAGVGAGDGSGMALQAEANPSDGTVPEGADLGEEDLEGGARSSTGGRDASTSSSQPSDQSEQAGEGATSSSQLSARQGGKSGLATGESKAKGLQSSPRGESRGSGSEAKEEGPQLAQKGGASDRSPARTLGPAGKLPGERTGGVEGSSGQVAGLKSPGGAESPEGPGPGMETGSGLPKEQAASGKSGEVPPGNEGVGDETVGSAGPGSGSKDALAAGGRTGNGSGDEGSMGVGEEKGGTEGASGFGRGDEGSDEMATALQKSGGPEREQENFGTGEGQLASGAGPGSGEEEVSEPMVVAKAPPPGDAARQRLEEMKRERMESAISGVQDVYFEFDSWRLREEDRKVLESNADWLKAHPQVSLTIEGHTDPRGTQAYNLTLGEKRAETVRRYLAELGVDPERMEIVSYGKERLICREQHERCFQMNRRGHLVVKTP